LNALKPQISGCPKGAIVAHYHRNYEKTANCKVAYLITHT